MRHLFPIPARLLVLPLLWGAVVDASAQFTAVPRLVHSAGRPEAGAVVELSGDGLIDLVSSAADNGRMLLHRGKGDGTFRFPQGLDIDGRAVAIVAGDIDRNGRDDVAWVDGDTGALGIIYQAAPGSYDLTKLPGEDEADGLALVDQDLDGWLDIVVSHRGADTLSLYRNDQGTILSAQYNPVGDAPRHVEPVFWPESGTYQFAVAQSGVLSSNVGIYDAEFRPLQLLTVPAPGTVTVIDWNADPSPDLMLTQENGRAHVYVGQPDGRFSPGPAWDIQLGGGTGIPLQDGSADPKRMLVLESARNRVAVFESTGGGPVQEVGGYFVGPGIERFSVGDVDEDGRREIYAPAPAEDEVVVLEEDGQGGFVGFPSYLTGRLPSQIEVVEAMGGLPLRVGVLCLNDDEIWIFERTGGTLARSQIVPVSADTERFRWAKINGDGLPDLVAMGDSTGVDVLLGSGPGFLPAIRTELAGKYWDIETLKVGTDPFTDILLADRELGYVRILEGDGAGNFAETGSFVCVENPVQLLTEDLDLDGRKDIIWVGENSRICLAFNDPEGFERTSVFQTGDEPRGVDVGRLVDDDMLPDISIGNAGDETFTVLASIFPRIYAVTTNSQLTPSGAQVAVQADLNNRGINDLVFCSPTSFSVSIHTNAGAGVFTIPTRLRCTSLPLDMATLDIDEDGWADLLVLDSLSATMVALRSQRDGSAVDETPTSTQAPETRVSLRLEPPYPNPSTGEVHFRLRTTSASARLAVYDLRGRLVAPLALRADGAGAFAATWSGLDLNGQSVARGRYAARLQADGQEVSRSIVRR